MSKLTFYDNALRYASETETEKTFNETELFHAFSDSLIELRKYCGLSLVKFSEATDIPNQTLSSYENKTRTPSVTQALKIAAYFGMTIEEFILCGLERHALDITELYEAKKKIQ